MHRRSFRDSGKQHAVRLTPRALGLRAHALGGGLCVVLAACQSAQPEEQALVPISSQGAALTATENTERALDGLLDSAEFLADSTTVVDTLNSFGGGSTSCYEVGTVCAPDSAECPPPEVVCDDAPPSVTEEDLQDARDELRAGIDDLVAWLRDEAFLPDNLEDETDTSATYFLPPELLCADGAGDDTALATPVSETADEAAGQGTADAAPDPECLERAQTLQPRLRLTSPAEGDVDIALLIAEQRFEPVVLELHKTSLAVRVDLGETLAAIDAVGDEDLSQLKTLDGVVQLELKNNGERDYSVRVNVLEDLVIAATDDEGRTLAYSMDKRSPAMELRAQGVSQTVSAALDLGALELLAPLAMFAGSSDELSLDDGSGVPVEAPPAKQYTGDIALLVAGLSGAVSYTAMTDELRFTNLGLGNATSTLKHDGNTLLAVDVNPDAGRRFSVTATADDTDDGAFFGLAPTLDLNVMLNFAALADQIDDLPLFALSDTVRLWFDGSDPTVAVSNDQIRMVSGAMHLSSAAHPEANLDVGEGMCLIAGGDDDPPPVADDAETSAESPAEEEPATLIEAFDVAVCE